MSDEQDDIKALREALAANPTPGPWESFYKHKYDEWHVSVPLSGQSMRLALFDGGCPTERPEADSNYIAAASPDRIKRLIENVERLTAKNDEAKANYLRARALLGEILARIHRDGGHYQTEHGLQKACADADRIVADLQAENDVLRQAGNGRE